MTPNQKISMTKLEKYNAVTTAYETKKVEDSRETISIIKDETPQEVREMLLTMHQDLDVGFDLSYEIMHEVSDALKEISLEELPTAELHENEFASVYTATRLSYLAIDNQYDITEIVKETSTDIQTACAIWYDRKCTEAAEMLRDYILQ